jgi:hypothetical protein
VKKAESIIKRTKPGVRVKAAVKAGGLWKNHNHTVRGG